MEWPRVAEALLEWAMHSPKNLMHIPWRSVLHFLLYTAHAHRMHIFLRKNVLHPARGEDNFIWLKLKLEPVKLQIILSAQSQWWPLLMSGGPLMNLLNILSWDHQYGNRNANFFYSEHAQWVKKQNTSLQCILKENKFLKELFNGVKYFLLFHWFLTLWMHQSACAGVFKWCIKHNRLELRWFIHLRCTHRQGITNEKFLPHPHPHHHLHHPAHSRSIKTLPNRSTEWLHWKCLLFWWMHPLIPFFDPKSVFKAFQRCCLTWLLPLPRTSQLFKQISIYDHCLWTKFRTYRVRWSCLR